MTMYNGIVSAIGKYGRAAEIGFDRAKSIFAGDETSNAAIRDKYLNGFLANESIFEPNVFSRLFDEPTYLTFRIEFDFRADKIENQTGQDKWKSRVMNLYDFMPEPLLSRPGLGRNDFYSTYNYLVSAKGEDKRADMLDVFIDSLKDIQDNYPYYFQSVDGLADLMKIDPKKGIRIPSDQNNVITIKCLEGLDMKITQLMQTYRKVVWDDYYQRWILPDMMRYFTMKIYVSEIRLFHSAATIDSKFKTPRLIDIATSLNSTSYDTVPKASKVLDTVNNVLNDVTAISAELLGTRSTVTAIAQGAGQALDTGRGLISGILADNYKLCNSAINNVMPTICFTCHQCEFVIDDTLSHIGSLSASVKETKPAEPTIKIKIGKVVDEQVYPLNKYIKLGKDEYVVNYKSIHSSGSGIQFNDDYLRNPKDNRQVTTENFEEGNDSYKNPYMISNTVFRMNPQISDEGRHGDGELAYKPHHTDRQDAAMSMLRSALNFFTQDEARSAATTIDSIKEYVYNGDVIRSVATSDENRQKLADGVFVQTLEEIVKSQATTGETALTKLSEHILDSLATNGELKIKK